MSTYTDRSISTTPDISRSGFVINMSSHWALAVMFRIWARPAKIPRPTLSAVHQRQGRALHPDDAERMGVQASLPLLKAPYRRLRSLASLLQSPSSTRSLQWAQSTTPGGLTCL